MRDEIRESCAPGTVCDEAYVPVGPGVSLRVCSFQPPHKSVFPTLVFVPGWISRMSAWSEVLHELTRDFKVIYIETREKITSRIRGDTRYGVPEIAEDIAGVVEQLIDTHEHYVLAGSSLGATAVIESFRILEKKPQGMMLISPNAEFRVPTLGLFVIRIASPYLYIFIRPIIKWYLRTFRLDLDTDYAQYAKYCGSLDAADPWKLKKAAIAFSEYQVWDALRLISIPVLVFGASKDILHEPDNMRRMLLRLESGSEVDLVTNRRTHSAEMVTYLRDYVKVLLKGEKR